MSAVMIFIVETFLEVFNPLCMAYTFVVLAACIVTWVNPDPYNPIVRFLRALTEPVFYRIRRLLPFVVVNGIDLSPVALLIALRVLQKAVNMLAVTLLTVSI